MIYCPKELILKNNKICILRNADLKDSEEMINFLKSTSAESPYMIRYYEEINISFEEEKKFLENKIKNPGEIILIAVVDNKIVASIGLNLLSPYLKFRHRREIGICVKKDYQNLGIASILMKEIISIAKNTNAEQIELEVSTENIAAINLYKKFGFKIYGERRNSYKFKDNTYNDMYLMILELKKRLQ